MPQIAKSFFPAPKCKLLCKFVKYKLLNTLYSFWVIPAEINTPSGRPYQILKTICGFKSTIPRITFGVLTRSDTLACSEESPCQVGRVGDFFRIFLRLGLTFHGVTFDRVA
jgi:hypothetical protein